MANQEDQSFIVMIYGGTYIFVVESFDNIVEMCRLQWDNRLAIKTLYC